jgi:hypothetical protein
MDSADDAPWFSGHIESSDGEALFRHTCAMNLAAIVSKWFERSYRLGPFIYRL